MGSHPIQGLWTPIAPGLIRIECDGILDSPTPLGSLLSGDLHRRPRTRQPLTTQVHGELRRIFIRFSLCGQARDNPSFPLAH